MPAILEPPDYKERVLIVGANGSGKSVLASALLGSGYDSWFVIDSKGDFEPPKPYRIVRHPDDWRLRVWPNVPTLYRPRPEYNNGPWLDEMLRRLYVRAVKYGKRHPFIVYVDEALYLARTKHVQWLAALAVSGRSLRVGLWVSSQRPVWIPVEVRSEAWRWYVFYLSYQQDEEEVLKYSKGRLQLPDLQSLSVDHSFYELRRGKGGKVGAMRFPAMRLPMKAEG